MASVVCSALRATATARSSAGRCLRLAARPSPCRPACCRPRYASTFSAPTPPGRRRHIPRTASIVFFLLGAAALTGPASRAATLLLDRDGSIADDFLAADALSETNAADDTTATATDADGLPELSLATMLDRGSPAEQALQARLRAAADATLPVVAELEGDPAWTEWAVGEQWADPADTASSSSSPPPSASTPARATRYTTGALGGLRGMSGYHRVFRNAASGEVVSVVFLGPALGGWPQTAHGGALATLLDEALGRCAIAALPAQTGVTARLELQYRRPVSVPGFYVVRCWPEAAAAADSRKLWCGASLQALDGKTMVEARGLFVVPRTYALPRVQDKF